jgi:Ca2+-binding RTX toxin-like protein
MRVVFGIRTVVAMTVLAALIGTAGTPAMARVRRCTVQGTNAGEVLLGTQGRDRICARGGDDTVTALGGNDVVLAGRGNDRVEGESGDDRLRGGGGYDTLEGNNGRDILRGDRGDDVIDVADGAGGDLAIGGKGTDTCFVNKADVTRGCETVHLVL